MSAKSRIVVLVVTVVGLLSVSFFLVRGYQHRHKQDASVINLPSGPSNISSVPGAGNPTEEYVQTQNLQNADLARQARKTGGSAVPTITRSDFIGNPSLFSEGAGGKNTTSCVPEKVVTYKPNPLNCSVKNLMLARRAGVTPEELLCQGCSASALKAAGYTAGALKKAGYSAKTLAQAGYTAAQLKAAGFSAAALKAAGFSPTELLKAGFSPAELKKAGYAAEQIARAGYSAKALAAAGLAGGNVASTKAACSVEKLTQARANGVSAEALKQEGCGAAAMKAAGFSAAELKKAGFSAGELAAAGFTPKALKEAGFSAKALREAGFSPKALQAAGFSAAELKKSGFSAGELAAAGFTPKDLKAAGFSAKALRDAGFSAAQLKKAGYTAAALKQAGYSEGDLLRAGYNTPGVTTSGYNTAGGVHQNGAEGQRVSGVVGANQNALRTVGSPGSIAGIDETTGNMALMTPEQKLAGLLRQSQKNLSAQQQQEILQEMRGAISMQATRMLTEWSAYKKQALQIAQDKSLATGAQQASGGTAAVGAESTEKEAGGVDLGTPKHLMKAGSIMYAVLDTALNTDEPSPILATVVNGALKGSKLIGRLARMHQRIFVSFTLLSNSNYYKSLPINAVAIDSNTARTALSGRVDNHYMLKYGTIFGASFLSGISDAILQPNQSSCIFGCTTNNDPLDTREQIAVGLGTAGRAIATDFKEEFSKIPPTIQIRAGTGIGVLVMNDLSLPASLFAKSSKGGR